MEPLNPTCYRCWSPNNRLPEQNLSQAGSMAFQSRSRSPIQYRQISKTAEWTGYANCTPVRGTSGIYVLSSSSSFILNHAITKIRDSFMKTSQKTDDESNNLAAVEQDAMRRECWLFYCDNTRSVPTIVSSAERHPGLTCHTCDPSTSASLSDLAPTRRAGPVVDTSARSDLNSTSAAIARRHT